MKRLDRLLQWWRIRMTARFIPAGCTLLDIGSWQGELADQVGCIDSYWGIDPKIACNALSGRKNLVRGYFPADLQRAPAPVPGAFDVVTMLAVLEHVPLSEQAPLALSMNRYLKLLGLVILTVPSPVVDRILDVLLRLRLIDGMSLEEHYGFNVDSVVPLFESAGFELTHRSRFQLGCNNMFVFKKVTSPPGQPIPGSSR